ncbi:flagellar biosynthesis protein [Clostridium sp. MSJ-4]|uniref:Flagellar biosynthesis protein n=1 Tax=Clostridium simiarum TaxID=2841506 RepID=A0ABS6EXX5_9CLOT|nr:MULTISPECIES: TIGR02530 family flagellar biosynthesis protein [Clostridium]MBU5591074.1 flagellar biosynthesis protein [Clostridium simiarum]
MSYRIINGKPYAIGNFEVYNSKDLNSKKVDRDLHKNSTSFKDVLDFNLEKEKNIKISNHASERMKELNIDFMDMEILKEGIDKAEKKGSKNSLLLYKDIAFVASVQNRTIITAVDKERAKENIFTNIDSVVML